MKTSNLCFLCVAAASALLLSACKDNDGDTPLAGITLSSTSLSMLPETSDTLRCVFYPDDATDKEVEWTSSDATVATVSAEGVVKSLKVGTAVVTATSKADKTIKSTCAVSVANRQYVNVSGDVSGTWQKNSTVFVVGHVNVPAGKSLTIEEGVQVIFSSNGVGTNHTPIEFMVNGNLYCNGTAANRIRFSVAENERTAANAFKGLWGGIVATKTCQEMLIAGTVIEYTGGPVLADSPSSLAGYYTAGSDADPQITTTNPAGRYVITHSVICNGNSDGIYMMGGKAIISHNLFYAIGSTGCEAINVKSGCKVDASYNLIYGPNTNGLKLSSAGQDDASGKTQALVRAYNNTIVNAGWRRDGVKGGSVYVEKNALVSVFNNLMVNCKFKAQTPKWGTPSITDGCATESVIDYNFYASGSQQSTLTQDVTNGTTTSYLGYTLKNKNVYTQYVDLHSIVSASAGDEATNPHFVNFPYNTNPLIGYAYDDAWDFHVSDGSPVLSGAYSGSDANMQPLYISEGLTVGGNTYKSEAFSHYFGAFGTK
jgi:hypothetical protein